MNRNVLQHYLANALFYVTIQGPVFRGIVKCIVPYPPEGCGIVAFCPYSDAPCVR